ncbi:S1C family serine protease [Persicobacter diffluens]|uniref:S1C family serine protease n=1 Tax=Persicobacter diffluens TaxID=981 RepID=UPI0030C76AC0
MTLLFCSGCVASIFNPRYQKIYIDAPKNAQVSIDGKKVKKQKGKYKVKRDLNPKEVKIEREGYKSQTKVIVQEKRSPLKYVSIALIPASVVVNPAVGWLMTVPVMFDLGPKAYNYKRELAFDNLRLHRHKEEEEKNIKINKVSMNVDPDAVLFELFDGVKRYRKDRALISDKLDEKLELENTIFTEPLNEILTTSGYIDQSNKVLKQGYLNDLILNVNINDLKASMIQRDVKINYSAYGGFVVVDLSTEWQVMNYYGEEVYKVKLDATSGQFAYEEKKESKAFKSAIKDALESSLLTFLNNRKVKELLKDKSTVEEEAGFEPMLITNNGPKVENVGQAIKSSVTIISETGHGSGFVIGEKGYIVTNYHVISDSKSLKVILNDGSEFTPEVIRTSLINDLVLLKINTEGLLPFRLSASREMEVATEVFAVGTPSAEDLGQTISKGIISGHRKNVQGTPLIQTDASVNGGNSGGALITRNGEVIGVVTSKLHGFGVEGVAFGIPAHVVVEKLNLNVVEAGNIQ